MPKSKHGEHGQLKVERIQARVTMEAKEGLEKIADSMNLSISELIERLGREELTIASSLGE